MKLVLKLIAFLIFAPIGLIVVLLAVAAAIVGLPLLWESVVAKLTAPPNRPPDTA